MTSDLDPTSEFVAGQQEYVTNYIQLADAKAGVAITATGGALVFLLNQDRFLNSLLGLYDAPQVVASIVTLLLLVASSAMSFYVIFPRIPLAGDSPVAWGAIASLSNGAEYSNKIMATDGSELIRARLSNIYNLSVACAQKYKWLRRAMIAGGLGFLSTFVYWIIDSAG